MKSSLSPSQYIFYILSINSEQGGYTQRDGQGGSAQCGSLARENASLRRELRRLEQDARNALLSSATHINTRALDVFVVSV